MSTRDEINLTVPLFLSGTVNLGGETENYKISTRCNILLYTLNTALTKTSTYK